MSFDRKPASPIPPKNAAVSRIDQDGRLIPPISQVELWAVRVPEVYVVPVSGGIAGAVSGLISCPLDVIKTKLQAQGGFKIPKDAVKLSTAAYRGVLGTAETIWREEGVRGMYRGLGPMLLGYVPTWAVYLTVYNKAQAYFRTRTGESIDLPNSTRYG
jgi:solute carrier family 25 folate transporter 32